MFGPLANAIATIIDIILNMLQLLILASIIISWVGADPRNQIVMMIRGMTEPIYRPIRKLTAGIGGPLDWAPLIIFLIIIFIQMGVLPYIRMLGTAAG